MSSIEFADNKPLTEDEIQAAAASELRTNLRYQDDALRSNWESAYYYYKGALPNSEESRLLGSSDPDADPDGSRILSTDVSDTIEWMLPAIIKPLVESPDVVRFDPVNPEDQEQADTESDYVHHTFMKKCDGFTKLYVHIKDALLLKVGVFATYWDEGMRHQKEEYKNLTEYELADLFSPADTSQVRVVSSQSREEPVLDPLTGQPLPPGSPTPEAPQGTLAPTQTLYDVVVRRYLPEGRPVVENCAPEEFYVRLTHDSINLTDARYCSYSVHKTRAELYAMKFDEDVVDQIPAMDSTAQVYGDNEVRRAREDVEREHNSFGTDRNQTGDPSQDVVVVHRVYIVLDADGDGFEERYLVLLGGGEGQILLDHYEVPENPFSASTPFIAGHKFHGYSIFDKLRQLTDHKTKLLRMLEDNLELINNPRKKVIKGQANLNDVLISQVGGIWRMDTPDAVQEVPTPSIAQNAFGILEYYDKMRSERSGIDPNAQSISKIMPEESMNHAMERVLSMKEELVGLMIRVFCETGVRDMFVKLRNLMLRHMPRGELVQLRNKWCQVNPGNWVERTNTTVVVGLGTGDRIKKQNGLLQAFGIQKELMEKGMMGPLISPERVNHTISELIRVTGLGDPDDFVLDPKLLDPANPNSQSPRGQEAQRAMQLQMQQQQQAQQAQQAQQQAQMQQQEALLGLQRELEQMRQQGKVMSEQIQAQTAERDRMAEMFRFMQEERRKWAELAVDKETDETKTAANVATTLLQQGAGIEQARTQAEVATKRGNEE